MSSLTSSSTLHYTIAATLASASLFYIFAPSIFPSYDASSSSSAKSRDGATAAVTGLSNAANDCFINSVLQALAASPRLRAWLDAQVRLADSLIHTPDSPRNVDEKDDDEEESADETPVQDALILTRALSAMLTRLTIHPPASRTISPRPFITALERAFGSPMSRAQQDAHELLQVVAGRLDDEAKALGKAVSSMHPPPADSAEAKVEVEAGLPLSGTLASSLTCLTCNYTPVPVRTEFNVLTLSVPQTWSADLTSCLDEVLGKAERVDGYRCAGCRAAREIALRHRALETASSEESDEQRLAQCRSEIAALERGLVSGEVDAVLARLPSHSSTSVTTAAAAPERAIAKYTTLRRTPALLAVHLSRSTYAGAGAAKNGCSVSFEEVLTLGGGASRAGGRDTATPDDEAEKREEEMSQSQRTYRLVAVVTHRGSHSSGHYETFRRQIAPGGVNAKQRRRRRPEGVQPGSAAADENPDTAAAAANTSTDDAAPPGKMNDEDDKAPEEQQDARSRDRWVGVSDATVRAARTKDVLAARGSVYMLLYEAVD